MNVKQLHKHSLPIIVLSIGLCIVSTLLISNFVIHAGRPALTLTQLLTERRLGSKPVVNGLFRSSRYQPDDQADSSLALQGQAPAGIGVIRNTGQTTTRDASLAR